MRRHVQWLRWALLTVRHTIPGDPEVPCRADHFHIEFKTPEMTFDMDSVGRGPTTLPSLAKGPKLQILKF